MRRFLLEFALRSRLALARLIGRFLVREKVEQRRIFQCLGHSVGWPCAFGVIGSGGAKVCIKHPDQVSARHYRKQPNE